MNTRGDDGWGVWDASEKSPFSSSHVLQSWSISVTLPDLDPQT